DRARGDRPDRAVLGGRLPGRPARRGGLRRGGGRPRRRAARAPALVPAVPGDAEPRLRHRLPLAARAAGAALVPPDRVAQPRRGGAGGALRASAGAHPPELTAFPSPLRWYPPPGANRARGGPARA